MKATLASIALFALMTGTLAAAERVQGIPDFENDEALVYEGVCPGEQSVFRVYSDGSTYQGMTLTVQGVLRAYGFASVDMQHTYSVDENGVFTELDRAAWEPYASSVAPQMAQNDPTCSITHR